MDKAPTLKFEDDDTDYSSSPTPSRKIRRRNRTKRPPPPPSSSTTMVFYMLYALRLLHKPVLLVLVLSITYTILAAGYSAALSTVCSLPLISFFPIPICSLRSSDPHQVQYADYPSLMSIQTSAFSSLPLTSTSALSLSIKQLELASADLKVLVGASTLPKKEVLANALGSFQEDAKVTARGLQKFGAMTSGALNQIEAVNAHALSLISEPPPPKEDYSILPWSSKKSHNQVVLDAFIMTMDTLSAELARLILFAQGELEHLDKLEEDSELLHTLLSFSGSSSIMTLDSVQKKEGSAVGKLVHPLGNLVKRIWKGHKTYTEDLLLSNLDLYRARAKLHIVSALTTLEGFLDELEDLRERVSTPGLSSGNVPVEVSMKSIQGGLDQLKKSRVRAREEDGRMSLGGL